MNSRDNMNQWIGMGLASSAFLVVTAVFKFDFGPGDFLIPVIYAWVRVFIIHRRHLHHRQH